MNGGFFPMLTVFTSWIPKETPFVPFWWTVEILMIEFSNSFTKLVEHMIIAVKLIARNSPSLWLFVSRTHTPCIIEGNVSCFNQLIFHVINKFTILPWRLILDSKIKSAKKVTCGLRTSCVPVCPPDWVNVSFFVRLIFLNWMRQQK